MNLLTDRELQVAMLMAHGCQAKEIGTRLHVSKSTVEKHKNSIYFKLKIGSGIDVAKWLVEHKHINPEEWSKLRRVVNHCEPQSVRKKPKPNTTSPHPTSPHSQT